MKLLTILKKNFKLLLRSKTSAFIILIGPLLAILLVGMFFGGKSSYSLSIGYYNPAENELTTSFISALKESDFSVNKFDSETVCVSKIEQGIIHTCIIFPQNFELGNDNSNTLRFLVDPSRTNLIYKIIESVSEILEIEKQELSVSLTEVLLSKISLATKDITIILTSIDQISSETDNILKDIDSAKLNAQSMNLDSKSISTTSFSNKVDYMNQTLEDIDSHICVLLNFSSALLEIIDDLDYDENETSELENDLLDLSNESSALLKESHNNINSVIDGVSSLSTSLSKIESDLEVSKQLNEKTKSNLDSAKTLLNALKLKLSDLKENLLKTKQSLESIDITSAKTIVSPVNTKIEPVVAESSKSIFTFPFLLVLVIMFVALLLSSTSIIFEKNSKAFFRNFITPTKPSLLIISSFLTSLIVIIFQVAIIMLLATFFLKIPVFNNALLTILVLLITSAFFILLGMAVGFLSSTQESAVMTSVILGSVFMFLSNLVIPLESIAPSLSKIIDYNPYVVASELIRKSLLFDVSFSEVGSKIFLLLIASIVLFGLMLLAKMIASKKRGPR